MNQKIPLILKNLSATQFQIFEDQNWNNKNFNPPYLSYGSEKSEGDGRLIVRNISSFNSQLDSTEVKWERRPISLIFKLNTQQHIQI